MSDWTPEVRERLEKAVKSAHIAVAYANAKDSFYWPEPLSVNDMLACMSHIDALEAESAKEHEELVNALAEVARMRPVVEAALERRAIHLAAGDDESEQERRNLLGAEVAEDLAVDTYRTEVQP